MNIRRLLIIGFVWPEPNSSAAGSRMLQIISVFKDQNFEITFASTALKSDYSANLASIGVRTQKIELNTSSFDEFVRHLQPSIVLFDRFMTEEQFGWRVAENCPDALRILDTEDLHCLRQARHLALRQNREMQTADLFLDIAKREIASVFRCDLSLIISEFEIELLQTTFHVNPNILYYLPFLLEPITQKMANDWRGFDSREGFVFVGNFHHEPNRDAIKYLNAAIWPLIKQALPEAVMNVYGAYIPQAIAQLHKPASGFLVHGRAASSADMVSKARVVLAPLRFGAGIKGKLTEAMVCGTPSVTTSIGAESMFGDCSWNGFIEDDPERFAQSAVSLYQQKQLWVDSCQNGIQIVNSRYQKSFFENDFTAKIESIVAQIKAHRMQNFTGEMLRHHTMASTKYMSRWIEEKNKSKSE